MSEQVGPGHLLPELYRLEQSGGWMQGMRRISHALLAGVQPAGALCVDIGCGGGMFAAEFAAHHPAAQVVGVDRSATAVATAQAQAGCRQDSAQPALAQASFAQASFAQADVHSLPFAAGSVGLVTAFDVLDQRQVDMAAALAEIHRLLRPGGLLLLRVSAWPQLAGPHDAAFGTGRRLHADELVEALEQARLRVLHLTYANTLMAGPIAVMRLLQRWGIAPYSAAVHARWADAALHSALGLESAWLRRGRLPIGISLYALAGRQRASG